MEVTYKRLNDPVLIAARDKWLSRIWDMYNGKSDMIFFLQGCMFKSTCEDYLSYFSRDMYETPEQWLCECLAYLDEHAENILDENTFYPVAISYEPYGVHFIDKILGAEVFFQDEQWYSNYLSTPVGQLTYPDLENNETWRKAQQTAIAFANSGTTLPVFGLPGIISTLNAALNIYGEALLVEMYENPENVMHDFNVINHVQRDMHNWFRRTIPEKQLSPALPGAGRTQPPGFGHVCGCSSQLISPELYRKFVMQFDAASLGVYPNGGMIHLCGSHSQHIPVWREMKEVRCVQINDRAACDLELYYKGLREDQLIYFNPCEQMTVDDAFRITGGHRTIFVAKCK